MLDINTINNITYIEKDGETYWFAEGKGKLHKLEKGGPGSGRHKEGGGKEDVHEGTDIPKSFHQSVEDDSRQHTENINDMRKTYGAKGKSPKEIEETNQVIDKIIATRQTKLKSDQALYDKMGGEDKPLGMSIFDHKSTIKALQRIKSENNNR